MNLADTSTTVFATIFGGRHRKARKTGVSRVSTLCNCGRGSPGRQARGFAGRSPLRYPHDRSISTTLGCRRQQRGLASCSIHEPIELADKPRSPALAADGRRQSSALKRAGALCPPGTMAEPSSTASRSAFSAGCSRSKVNGRLKNGKTCNEIYNSVTKLQKAQFGVRIGGSEVLPQRP